MLDIRTITEQLDATRRTLSRRGPAAAEGLDRMAQLGGERKAALVTLEALRQRRNEVSGSLASVDKKSDAFQAARDEMKRVGEEIKGSESVVAAIEAELEAIWREGPSRESQLSACDEVRERVRGDGAGREVARWLVDDDCAHRALT